MKKLLITLTLLISVVFCQNSLPKKRYATNRQEKRTTIIKVITGSIALGCGIAFLSTSPIQVYRYDANTRNLGWLNCKWYEDPRRMPLLITGVSSLAINISLPLTR